MMDSLDGGVLSAALCLAALMGFAVQRGATCTVVAVDELLRQRRADRLLSMLEASLWVAGILLFASVLRVSTMMPVGQPLSWRLFSGGVLLGVGAYINRACVLGAIARLSNGEWSYLATPVGFLAGCVAVRWLPASSAVSTYTSPLFRWPEISTGLFILFVCARLGSAMWRVRMSTTVSRHWTPGAATVVIGIAYVLLLLLVGGNWGYTDALAEISSGAAHNLGWRIFLLFALYAGGLLGGYLAGRWHSAPIQAVPLARCFAGGLLMGAGSLLIPGSNDGLILLGMPLLLPHAWLAFLTMCITIALLMLISTRNR